MLNRTKEKIFDRYYEKINQKIDLTRKEKNKM